MINVNSEESVLLYFFLKTKPHKQHECCFYGGSEKPLESKKHISNDIMREEK